MYDTDRPPLIVEKWDPAQVKTALDEMARQYIIDKFKYEEWNLIIDIRLFLCFLPLLASLYSTIYDLFVPFPESAPVLKACVYGYIISMLALTIFTSTVETYTILIAYKKGLAKDKTTKVRVQSFMKPYDDMYTLTVEGPVKRVSSTKSVGDYFDVNGVLIDDILESEVDRLYKQASSGHNKIN